MDVKHHVYSAFDIIINPYTAMLSLENDQQHQQEVRQKQQQLLLFEQCKDRHLQKQLLHQNCL